MSRPDAIVIGGSAGAVEALGGILGRLPAGYGPPIVVVVHLPPRRPSALVSVLGGKCRLAVLEAQDKEPLAKGTVYVAPPDYHLLLDVGPALALSIDGPVNFSMPSIDVLFESAADLLGARAVGVVLSGANADGARGLRAIQERGGLTVVQAPESAGARAMPEAALAACPGALRLEPSGIAQVLMESAAGVCQS